MSHVRAVIASVIALLSLSACSPATPTSAPATAPASAPSSASTQSSATVLKKAASLVLPLEVAGYKDLLTSTPKAGKTHVMYSSKSDLRTGGSIAASVMMEGVDFESTVARLKGFKKIGDGNVACGKLTADSNSCYAKLDGGVLTVSGTKEITADQMGDFTVALLAASTD